MAFVDTTNEIEHLKFAAHVGTANSFRIFLRNISEEKAIKDLLALTKSRDVGLKILDRIVSLSKLKTDFKYMNRFDIPLAAYLWVLSRTFPDLALAGAEVCVKLPRIWWAERVTDYVLGKWTQKPATGTSTGVLYTSPTYPLNTNTTNAAAHTSIFLADSLFTSAPMKDSLDVRLETAGTSSETTQANSGEHEVSRAFTLSTPEKDAAESK